jgi:hypothetical protein
VGIIIPVTDFSNLRWSMKRIAQFTVAATAAVFLTAVPASAALIGPNSDGLTLDTDPAVFYQQSAISPCVIGPTNCLNGGFAYTVAGPGGAGSLFDEYSPTYDIGTILGVVGNSFTVGIDFNQTAIAQTLFTFRAEYLSGGDVQSSQTWSGPTVLQVNNNGVGFSDFLLSGFNIAAGTEQVRFFASWFNNDGADRFFLIGAQADPDPIPEPMTLTLFGLALLGAGAVRRSTRR